MLGIDQEGTVKPLGEMKGIFKSIDSQGATIIVHLESEEFLELKVRYYFSHFEIATYELQLSVEGTPPTPKRISDWVKVIRALSG